MQSVRTDRLTGPNHIRSWGGGEGEEAIFSTLGRGQGRLKSQFFPYIFVVVFYHRSQ